MATIDIQFEGSLFIATVRGDLSPAEIITVINEYYPTGKVTDVIWDLTDGSMLTFTNDDLAAIADAAKKSASNGARRGGRTYFVGTTLEEYSLFCKYMVVAELLETTFKYHVFKTIDEAKRILDQSKQNSP